MQLSTNDKQRLKQKYGTSALITGASSGIGQEIALQLASAGFNLLLCARSEAALKATAEKIQSSYPVQVSFVSADLSKEADVQKLISQADSLPIGLLVASAGFGTSGEFIKNSLEEESNMLQLNCQGLLSLTHHFGRKFAAQKRGGIILLSSVVAFQGVPYSAHYAATKAYVQTLAEGISAELKPYGVDVLSAAPGPVKTGFGDRAKMQMGLALDVEYVGVPILKALGKQTTVFPGWLTKLLAYSLRTLPRGLKILVMGKAMGDITKH